MFPVTFPLTFPLSFNFHVFHAFFSPPLLVLFYLNFLRQNSLLTAGEDASCFPHPLRAFFFNAS